MTTSIPPAQIVEQLKPSERLLWSGRPQIPTFLATLKPLVILVGLLLCFQLWMWWPEATFSMDKPGEAIGFAAVAVIALNCLFGHAVIERMRLDSTYYGVTSTRIIISYGLLMTSLRSISYDLVDDLKLRHHEDGTGTIDFDTRINVFGGFGSYRWYVVPWPRHNPDSFERVENPEVPFEHIRQAIKSWQASDTPPPPPPGLLDISRYTTDD